MTAGDWVLERWGAWIRALLLLIWVSCGSAATGAGSIRIATFNVENYLVENRRVDDRWMPNYPKPEVEKAAVRRILKRVNSDIVIFQEMGKPPFLEELRADLRTMGLDYPYARVLEAEDEQRHLAVVSRVPFRWIEMEVGDFPYFESRLFPKRGLLAVHFDFGEDSFVIFGVHLKSKWTDYREDPQSARRRVGEARVIRDAIRRKLPPETAPRYLVVGDFNDTRASSALNHFLSVGNQELTRMVPTTDSRGHAWTHHFAREDVYSRVDYILASPALFADVKGGRGVVEDSEDTLVASDHRLVWVDLKIGKALGGNGHRSD